MVPLAVSNAAVDALLPSGLVRAEQSATPPGTHPILLPLAHNYNTRPSWLPLFSLDYLEYSVVIPYVARSGSASLLTYIPILFLNKLFPILLGRLVYGFPKRSAHIASAPPLYQANLSSGTTLVEADLPAYGDALPPAEYPHFAQIDPMLRFPIVTRWMGLLYVCSDMNWELDTAARIRPVSGELLLTEDFIPNLEERRFTISGIDRQPLGAFLLTTQWTFSLPHFCGS